MSFLDFGILDFIDILLVSLLLYQLYKLIRGTVAMKIFMGVISLYLIWKLVQLLQMELLSEILGQFIGVGVLALIIVFQQEIRKFLILIGNTSFNNRRELVNLWRKPEKKVPFDIQSILTASEMMSLTRTGAIIIIRKNDELSPIIKTGETLNADLSHHLLESIFFKNNPLHDGAVIVSEKKIIAAKCVLPLSEKDDFPAHMGLRHRAAVGITENSDAMAVIVSEQNGHISFCFRGEMKTNLKISELEQELSHQFQSS